MMHGLPLLLVFAVMCCRAVHTSTVQVDIKGRALPSSRVSRLIHQSWVDLDVPDKFKEWQESWAKLNPGWKYVMWTDNANRCAIAPLLFVSILPIASACSKYSTPSRFVPLQGACGEALQVVCSRPYRQDGGVSFLTTCSH